MNDAMTVQKIDAAQNLPNDVLENNKENVLHFNQSFKYIQVQFCEVFLCKEQHFHLTYPFLM